MHTDLYFSFLITIGILIYYSININGCRYPKNDIRNLDFSMGTMVEHDYRDGSIPSYNGIIETEIIERSCDLVISATNGIFFHDM